MGTINIETTIKKKSKNGKLVPVATNEDGSAVKTVFPINIPDVLDLSREDVTTEELVAEFGNKVCSSHLRNSLRVAFRDPARSRLQKHLGHNTPDAVNEYTEAQLKDVQDFMATYKIGEARQRGLSSVQKTVNAIEKMDAAQKDTTIEAITESLVLSYEAGNRNFGESSRMLLEMRGITDFSPVPETAEAA